MAVTVLGKVGEDTDDGLEFEAPLVPEVAVDPGVRRQRGCLGKREDGVPEAVHALMEASAAEGGIPVTTLARRISARNSTKAEIGVPAELIQARNWGYIHPVLPAPAGYRWRFKNRKWTLGLRGG